MVTSGNVFVQITNFQTKSYTQSQCYKRRGAIVVDLQTIFFSAEEISHFIEFRRIEEEIRLHSGY